MSAGFGVRSSRFAEENAPRTQESLYDRFAARYADFRLHVFPDDRAEIGAALDLGGARRLAELGCGPGFYAIAYAATFPHLHVTGIDRAPAQVAIARRRAASRGLTNTRFTVADAQALSGCASGSFDRIIASRLLMIVDDPAAAVTRVRPWLSWAWTEATFLDFMSDANANANSVDFSGNAVPRVPRNTITAGLDVGMRAGAYLTSTYQHVTRVPVTFDNSTWVRGYDLLGAKLGVQRTVARRWTIDAFVGGDNLLGNTVYSFLFVGPNYRGLATPPYGGTGDGYIIPAPYSATVYGNLTLRYIL